MKKNGFFIIVLISLFLTQGCGRQADGLKTPEFVLRKYLNASLYGYHGKAYDYVSRRKKSGVSRKNYAEEKQMEYSLASKSLADKISYKIASLEISGDSANARVDVTMPDVDAVFSEVSGEELVEKVEAMDFPSKNMTVEINMVKEIDGWKIDED